MIIFNPAALLTANRIPYATGAGRLADSGITFNPAGNVTVIPAATGGYFANESLSAVTNNLHVNAASVGLCTGAVLTGFGTVHQQYLENALGVSTLAADFGVMWTDPTSGATAADWFWRTGVNQAMSGRMWLKASGNLCLGTQTDSSNGRLQLLSHSALSGGLAFGSHATEETIYRWVASGLRTGGTFTADSGLHTPAICGAKTFNSSNASVAAGWALPTGTQTRTTFNTATVTLPQLAERVFALLYDLHAAGHYTADSFGHALLNS